MTVYRISPPPDGGSHGKPKHLAIGPKPKPGERGLRDMKARYGAILNVISERHPDLALHYGALYVHEPMIDGVTVDMATAERLAHMVCTWLEEGLHVYVHCRVGRNRSALIAALVTRRLFGFTGLEAIEYVRACRPRALANPAMVAALEPLPSLFSNPKDILRRSTSVDLHLALKHQPGLGL